MLKLQPPMLIDEVCRMATDKHTALHKKTKQHLPDKLENQECTMKLKKHHITLSNILPCKTAKKCGIPTGCLK